MCQIVGVVGAVNKIDPKTCPYEAYFAVKRDRQ